MRPAFLFWRWRGDNAALACAYPHTVPDTPLHLTDDNGTPPTTPAPRAAAARVPSGASAAAQTVPPVDLPQATPVDLPVLTDVVALSTAATPTVAVEPPASSTEPAAEIVDQPEAATPEPTKPVVPDLSPVECAARLAELFPALFAPAPNTPPKPIKLRIQADIQARAPGLFSRRSLSPFLHRHTTSTAYLRALVGSPHRFDLDGAPAGEVSDEHRQAAQLELERRRAIVQARRAAERLAGRGGAGAPEEPGTSHPRPPRRDGGGPQTPRTPKPPGRTDEQRSPRPPRATRPQQAQRDVATPPVHRPRPDRPPRHAPATPVLSQVRPEPVQPVAALPDDPARRERALLLRAYEATTLSRANFCALKRIDPAALDALLEQARSEARPTLPPKRRSP